MDRKADELWWIETFTLKGSVSSICKSHHNTGAFQFPTDDETDKNQSDPCSLSMPSSCLSCSLLRQETDEERKTYFWGTEGVKVPGTGLPVAAYSPVWTRHHQCHPGQIWKQNITCWTCFLTAGFKTVCSRCYFEGPWMPERFTSAALQEAFDKRVLWTPCDVGACVVNCCNRRHCNSFVGKAYYSWNKDLFSLKHWSRFYLHFKVDLGYEITMITAR